MEQTSNIPKYTGDKAKHPQVIINREWGAFGEKGELDDFRNPIDEELDKGAVNVKQQQWVMDHFSLLVASLKCCDVQLVPMFMFVCMLNSNVN